MDTLRYDGKVAVITGAGGNPGLGRAHALLLASRGAKIVVNDIGRSTKTQPLVADASAALVAAEIRALGGDAVADTNSVATKKGAHAIIQTALDTYGRIDILINNAALCILARFDEITSSDIMRIINVNLMGTIWTSRAAWTHMREKAYGRIVNITSSSFFGSGSPRQSIYAASKGGIFAITNGLAAEGVQLGIRVNSVITAAYTRMVIANHKDTSPWIDDDKKTLHPELTSPIVAYLSHEECPSSGACLFTSGGNIQRLQLKRKNILDDADLTIETIAQNWAKIVGSYADSTFVSGNENDQNWQLRSYIPDHL